MLVGMSLFQVVCFLGIFAVTLFGRAFNNRCIIPCNQISKEGS